MARPWVLRLVDVNPQPPTRFGVISLPALALIDVRFAPLPARRVDKFGNPLVTFKAGLHVPEKFDYKACVRFFVYNVALGLKRVADGKEQSSDEVLAGKAPFRISFVSGCM